jgi:C-terminal processing protease CtpA/Prc
MKFSARRNEMKKSIRINALVGVLFLMAFMVLGPAAAKKYNSEKAWLGVYTQAIDEDLQEAFNLDADEGLVIVDVVDDSPAEDAGLRRKDIIVKINGESISDSKALVKYVGGLEIGDEAEVVVLRKGKEKTITVEVGERPERDWVGFYDGTYSVPRTYTRNFSYSSGSSGYIGVAIQDLSEQLGEYFGVEDGEGVLVTEVYEDSPAAEAGLKAGDVIISVDDESIAETSELQEAISEKEEGDEVVVGYIRKGQKDKATVEVTEESFGLQHFTIPDFNVQIPNLQGLGNLGHFYFGDDDDLDHYYFDRKEYKKEMEQLKKELKEMSRELKEIRKKLE